MILVSILVILLGISVLVFLEYKENFSGVSIYAFVSGCVSFIGFLILCLSCFKEPSAIDVYRGNTTLKVTYINKIPVDTVVIFKHK